MEKKNDVKSTLEATISDIQRLRDEIRVQLHLANAEAKSHWRELEPRLGELERRVETAGEQAADAAAALAHDVKRAFKQFRDRLTA